MSVLIKGMKIPLSCFECGQRRFSSSANAWCALTGNFVDMDIYLARKERPNDCPLVEVPDNNGKWESYLYDEKYFFANYCSECKTYLPYGIDWKPNFCPNCGADMRQ